MFSQDYRRIAILLIILMASNVSLVYGDSMFTDMVESHWAYEYVKELVHIGLMDSYEDGTFRPNEVVNIADALVYITRLLNLSEEEIHKIRLEHEYILNRFDLSQDREDAIAIALDKGLVTEAFVNNNLFSKGDLRPVTKVDVSKYIAIVLGMGEPEEGIYAFLYKDTAQIPERVRPYIKFLIDKGILDSKGDGEGNFNPNQPVTRAVLAKMLYLAYSQVAEKLVLIPEEMEATESALVDEYDLTGIITARVDKFLIIDDGQRLDSYQLDKDAKIIIDDIERGEGSIQVGLNIKAVVHDGNIIKKLVVDNDLDIFSGVIHNISLQNSSLSILVDSMEGAIKTFNISEDAHISLNGKKAYLFNLKEGDWVKLEAFDDIALKITGEGKDGKVEGRVVDMDLDGRILLVEREDESTYEYSITNNTTIYRNSNSASLEELRRKDVIVLTISKGELEVIEAKSVPGIDEGYIKEILISASPKLTISDQGEEREYFISPKALIKKDEKIANLYHLRLDDYVRLNLESDEIMAIEVLEKR